LLTEWSKCARIWLIDFTFTTGGTVKNRIAICSHLVVAYGVAVFSWFLLIILVFVSRPAELEITMNGSQLAHAMQHEFGTLYAFAGVSTSTLVMGAITLAAIGLLYFTPFFAEYRLEEKVAANLRQLEGRSRVLWPKH